MFVVRTRHPLRYAPGTGLGLLFGVLISLLLSACAGRPLVPFSTPQCLPTQQTTPSCPACPVCAAEPARPAAVAAYRQVDWQALPGWPTRDSLRPSFEAWRASCSQRLASQSLWQASCASAAQLSTPDETQLAQWFEDQFQPWQLVNPDGTTTGLVTGYYEPVLKASRRAHGEYRHPIYGPPDDLIEVSLAELYPELKHMRLRGRLVGNKLLPYYPRAEWEQLKNPPAKALFWANDPLDVFFLQIQGSGQIQLDDQLRVRVNYANQNGQPYRSIGRWLIDQGELKPGQASMQGIRAWLKKNPQRMQELLGTNPSYVFFRELPLTSPGPPGALAVPLTAERSIAIDPRHTPLGAPVWLDTTEPNSERPLTRLMLAQDTGGAIRGPVRADFFWGSGDAAGQLAGRMSQRGQMWLLLPKGIDPLTRQPDAATAQ